MPEPIELTIDEIQLKENRKKAEEYASNQTIEEFYALRKRAKSDLFFLAFSVLGYDKLARLHYDLCQWLKETEVDQYREILLPRSHLKSTICTIADSIQSVLPDDSNNAVDIKAYGTDCRILLTHEVHESAALFLTEITNHFLTNPILMGLFPECIPDLKKHRVNKWQLELPRKKNWKEPTFSTLSTGGRAQGQHFNIIKADDLIGDKARDSKTEMESAKLWVDNLQSLLVTPRTDHIDFIGTRWAFDDLYAHLHNTYGSRLKKYVRGIEEKDKTGRKYFIFPEQFTEESVAILRKNRKVFSAQYANDPKEAASEFQEDWLKYYEKGGRNFIKFGQPDSATLLSIYDDLDRVILVDPAMSGLGAIVVTGMDTKENKFVLEALKDNWTPAQLIDLIFRLVVQYQPRIVGIEHVLFSALFSLIFANEMAKRGTRFQVQGLKTFGKAKDFRVRGLSHYFAAGQLYFHESQTDLIEEFNSFGATDNYHILDALAHGPQVWRKPIPNYLKDSEIKYLPGGVDNMTGYSEITL